MDCMVSGRGRSLIVIETDRRQPAASVIGAPRHLQCIVSGCIIDHKNLAHLRLPQGRSDRPHDRIGSVHGCDDHANAVDAGILHMGLHRFAAARIGRCSPRRSRLESPQR